MCIEVKQEEQTLMSSTLGYGHMRLAHARVGIYSVNFDTIILKVWGWQTFAGGHSFMR